MEGWIVWVCHVVIKYLYIQSNNTLILSLLVQTRQNSVAHNNSEILILILSSLFIYIIQIALFAWIKSYF